MNFMEVQMAKQEKKFIQKAIKKPGALHKQLGVPEDEKIPKSKLEAAAKKGNTKLAKRARLALTLEKMPHKGAKKSTAKKSSTSSSRRKTTASRSGSTRSSKSKK